MTVDDDHEIYGAWRNLVQDKTDLRFFVVRRELPPRLALRRRDCTRGAPGLRTLTPRWPSRHIADAFPGVQWDERALLSADTRELAAVEWPRDRGDEPATLAAASEQAC